MPLFQFKNDAKQQYRVQQFGDRVRAGGTDFSVEKVSHGCYVASCKDFSEQFFAVAHGDTIEVQCRGRAWRLQRIDPTLSSRISGDESGAGTCVAPMPGVVISVLVTQGQQVLADEALMVIESMKLQMTISAPFTGEIADLPLQVGQGFQRGAALVQVRASVPAAEALP